ncbi:MAG: hypothetical protein Marn2KO_36200 [Marinobacter nauticus]
MTETQPINPVLSVVICTYNRRDFVDKAISAFDAQMAEDLPVELIVVNNNSSDDTQDLIEEWADKRGYISARIETEQGLSAARNNGWKAARGRYVGFLDDDATADKDWLSAALEALQNCGEALIIGGPIYPVFEDSPPWIVGKDHYIRTWSVADAPLEEKDAKGGFFGGNMIIRRDTLAEFGGFDPNYGMKGDKVWGAEEYVLFNAIHDTYGNRTWYAPRMAIHHFEGRIKTSVSYILKRGWIASQIHCLKLEQDGGGWYRFAGGVKSHTVLAFKNMYRWITGKSGPWPMISCTLHALCLFYCLIFYVIWGRSISDSHNFN